MEFQRSQRETDWPGRLPTKREVVGKGGLQFILQELCGAGSAYQEHKLRKAEERAIDIRGYAII